MYSMTSHSTMGGLLLAILLCSVCVQETVAQITNPPQCPDGWTHYRTPSNGLTCTVLSKDKASWIDAMSWCKVLGGQLVEIGTSSFNNHVTAAIRQRQTGKYWIGSTKVVGHLFKWMTSGAVTPFQFFKQQQMSNAKNCAATDEKGIWIDEDCKAHFWFICQQIISP